MPRGRAGEATPERAGPPAPSTPPWESVLEDVPSTNDAFDLPSPPRAGYPRRGWKSSSRRHRGNNPEIGFTIAGFYVLFVVVVGIAFLVWKTAAEPPQERVDAIFTLVMFFVHAVALVLGFAGAVWLLVLAFREKMMHGFCCMLVPFYAFYYVATRWEDTKVAFILQLLHVVNVIIFAAGNFSINYVKSHEKVHAKTVAQPSAESSHRITANRFRVEEAENIYRDYIRSIDGLTNQFAVIRRPGNDAGSLHGLIMSINMAKMMETRAQHVNLGKNGWIALKHRVRGHRAWVLSRTRCGGSKRFRGCAGCLGMDHELIDKEVPLWTIKPGEEVAPELVDGPSMPMGPRAGRGSPPGSEAPWSDDSRPRKPGDRTGTVPRSPPTNRRRDETAARGPRPRAGTSAGCRCGRQVADPVEIIGNLPEKGRPPSPRADRARQSSGRSRSGDFVASGGRRWLARGRCDQGSRRLEVARCGAADPANGR